MSANGRPCKQDLSHLLQDLLDRSNVGIATRERTPRRSCEKISSHSARELGRSTMEHGRDERLRSLTN